MFRKYTHTCFTLHLGKPRIFLVKKNKQKTIKFSNIAHKNVTVYFGDLDSFLESKVSRQQCNCNLTSAQWAEILVTVRPREGETEWEKALPWQTSRCPSMFTQGDSDAYLTTEKKKYPVWSRHMLTAKKRLMFFPVAEYILFFKSNSFSWCKRRKLITKVQHVFLFTVSSWHKHPKVSESNSDSDRKFVWNVLNTNSDKS